jgi:hypothetical protein
LGTVFTDVDNDDASITKAVQSNSNPGLVSATIASNILTLDYQVDQNGSATILIRGTSNSKTVDDTFQVTVNAVNDSPQITSANVDTAQENLAYSYTAIATDPDNTPNFLFENYPGWLSPSGNTLSGTAPYGSRGDTMFTVIASDGVLADTLIVQLAIKDSNGIVPVELSSFTAEGTVAGIILSWSTESEQDNLGFNVLRSTDGKTGFEQINRELIPGAGTSMLPHSYSYTDPDVGSGTWYYRLVQVDNNGNRRYSDIISVTVKGLSVGFPRLPDNRLGLTVTNPTRTVITLRLHLDRDEVLKVTLQDAAGTYTTVLLDGKLSAREHEYIFSHKLTPGWYFIRVTGDTYSIMQKILVIP